MLSADYCFPSFPNQIQHRGDDKLQSHCPPFYVIFVTQRIVSGHSRFCSCYLQISTYIVYSCCFRVQPNCQDVNGETPLHLAALNGHKYVLCCTLSDVLLSLYCC